VTLLNNGHPITGTEAGGRAELALSEVERRPAAALVGVGEEADQNWEAELSGYSSARNATTIKIRIAQDSAEKPAMTATAWGQLKPRAVADPE